MLKINKFELTADHGAHFKHQAVDHDDSGVKLNLFFRDNSVVLITRRLSKMVMLIKQRICKLTIELILFDAPLQFSLIFI